MRASATAAAAQLTATAAQQRAHSVQSLTAAIDQVQTAFTSAQETIDAQRRAKLDAVTGAATTRRGDLNRIVDGHKRALAEAAETAAGAAGQAGTDEAARATRESAAKAARARAIGEEKVTRYRGYDRANRIARVAREMAGEAAGQMGTEAREVAAAVQKDARDMAAKFRREARDGGAKFEDARTAARRKIDEEERKAVEGINKSATDAITGLRGQRDRLTGQLRTVRDAAAGQLTQLGGAAARGMATQATRAEQALDAQSQAAEESIDQFCVDVSQQVPGVPASAAGQVVDEADAQLGSSLGEFDSAQAGQVAETDAAFQTGAADGQQRITGGVTQLIGPLTGTAATFETTAADASSTTSDAIGRLATTATGGMETATTDVDTKLGQAVTDSRTRWDGQLGEGTRQMTRKVNDALAAQDRALAGLGGKISDKAEEIEHESWWDRALSFVGGVIAGFFLELWDLVKGLLLVLLVILAIVVVIALIVVVILLAVKGLAGIAVALAFLAAVAAIAKVALIVLAVIGVVVVVVMVGWRLYQAWSRDDLSDYERGKLVGRSITDVLSLLVPGRVLARLRGWVRMRQLARSVGGQARLARLLVWANGDLVAIERIAGELNRLDDFEVLLTRTASLDEFLALRRLCNGDIALAIRMLRHGTAAELIPAIAEFGGDVVLLDRLATELNGLAAARRVLTMAGGDVARLRRWIQFFEGAGPMEAMFQQVGRDAGLLDDLVTRTANRAELTRLIARLRGNAPALRDLLLLTDDVPQLDRMLTMMANDGVELRRLLTLAGGRPAAATVEQLMILTRSEGRAVANIQAILDRAAGNVAELARILGIARRFAGRMPPGQTTIPAPPYTGARIDHALDGHTYAFFNFARVTAQGKTFWPPGSAGDTLARVQADMQHVLTTLRTPGAAVTRAQNGAAVVTPTHVVPPAVAPGAGQVRGPVHVGPFQFGTRGAAPHEGFQFFPRPGPGFEHHPEPLLRAIEQIMAVL